MNKENKTLLFKTNIDKPESVEKINPILNEAEGICHWKLETSHKDKILSVHSLGITKQEVIQKVKQAGFEIELLNQ